MRAVRILQASWFALAGLAAPALAQTTAGTSATIVVPIIAQTGSFASEVTVYNPNLGSITVQPAFYDAQNTATPGLKPCTSLFLPAARSAQFSVATQCALPAGAHFGLLILTEQTGTQRFYGYARTQTPQGVGFSTEGFPIENFNDQLQHATGLKRLAANAGLPAYTTNCFATTLGDAVNFELRLFDGTTNAQLGGTLAGSLQPFQQFRYLDVFAQAGVAAGDRSNVRAEFTNLTGATNKLIGFCTVQENTALSADFRIAKSYGGTPQNAFVQGGNAFGTTALLGTSDSQPLNISVNGQRAMRYEPASLAGFAPNVIGGFAANFITSGVLGATIGGGGIESSPNRVTDSYGTVGGGFGNLAGDRATVAGGYNSTASGFGSVVGGGQANVSSGLNGSTVAGGFANVASGNFATVPGGDSNLAQGSFSFAAGHHAIAAHDRAFVWNGWSSGTAGSFRHNSFQIHGESGLSIEYGSRRVDGGGTSWVFVGTGFAGQAIATSTGAFLSSGGQWINNSDRDRKTAQAPIDPRSILEKVSALPIGTWQYIDEDASIRHIGPMAQDFHAAFAVGDQPTSIGTVDADGVALAAIQGLHVLVREKDAKIDAQQREIVALQRRMTEIDSLRGEMAALKAALTAAGAFSTARHDRPSAR